MEVRGFIVPSRLVGILFLVIAIISSGLAFWFYTSTNRFLAHAISVPGIVTDLKPSTGSEGTTYATEFEFTDATGTKHRAVTSWASSSPAYSVGSTVEVLYLAGDPSSARLRSFASLWIGAIIWAALALPPLILSVVFVWLVPFTIGRVWPTQPRTAH